MCDVVEVPSISKDTLDEAPISTVELASPVDSGRESTSSTPDACCTPPTQATNAAQATTTSDSDKQYHVRIVAPGAEPFELLVNGGELVQELHQVLLDRENTCHRTCFTLQLNGTPLDHFTEWKAIEGMRDQVTLKVVEEPYTLREARIHLRHVRDLLRSLDAADAYNGNDGASLSYAGTVSSIANSVQFNTKDGATSNDYGVALSAAASSTTAVLLSERERRTRMTQSVAERAAMDCTPPEYALPGARERPLAPLHPLNRELSSANQRCVRYLAPSGWNPPPPGRKLRGDVMYFVVHTLEDRRYHITCCTRGFYVNLSTDDSFNPLPADNNAKVTVHHSLIELLNHLSPQFKRNFALIQKRRAQRQIFERLPTPYQTYAWTVPPTENSLDYVRAEDGTQSHRLGLEDHIPGQTRDWNEELQTTRELPRGTLHERLTRERAIFKIHSDFVAAAVKGAMAVVDGNVMAINPGDEPRTHMFIWNNIFFSLGFDVKDHYKELGGDAAAFVAPSNDLQGVRAFAQLDSEKLFTLGMVIVDYRGYRVTAQSIIPGILDREQEQSVVYGSIDFGYTICSTPKYEELLAESATALKILPHKVRSRGKNGESGEGTVVTLYSSFEAKGIVGNDGRHYVLDLLRTTPPDVHFLDNAKTLTDDEPLVSELAVKYGYPRALPHKLACLRQELVDAFVESRYHTFLRIAAYHLNQYKAKQIDSARNTLEEVADESNNSGDKSSETKSSEEIGSCPPAAAQLDQSEARRIVETARDANGDDQQGSEQQSETQRIVANTARLVGSEKTDDFVLRFNPDCYCDTVEHAEPQEELLKQRQLVRDAARFLLSNQLPAVIQDCTENSTTPIDGAGLVEAMHARGINVRYLGKLVECVGGEPTFDYIHTIGVTELVARAVKHIMRTYLQSVSAANLATAIAHFLNCLLAPTGDVNGTTRTPLANSAVNTVEENGKTRGEKNRSGGRNTNKKHAAHVTLSHESQEWQQLTAAALWSKIVEEIDSYYGFKLNANSIEQLMHTYNVHKMALLRRCCQLTGVQLVSRDYQLETNRARAFSEDDVLLLTPLVKHINPRANDATHYYHAGQSKIQQGQLRAGYELIMESLNLLNSVYGAMHQEIAQCMHLLARLAFILGDTQEAQTYQLKAVQMSERCIGIDSAATIHEYTTLAHYAFANLQVTVALRMLYRARYLLLLAVGNEQHPFLAQIDANIGIMLYAVQECDLALKYLESAHRLSAHYHGKSSLKTAMLSHLIARAHGTRGDYRTALQHEKETYNIYRSILGDSHEKTRESSECLKLLTQQAVNFQKKMNEASRMDERSTKGQAAPVSIAQLLPTMTHNQPTVSSIIDMLNVFNGVVYLHLPTTTVNKADEKTDKE